MLETHNDLGEDLQHNGALAGLDVSAENPIIVICDGCGTHNTVQVLEFAKANGIIPLCLPPHTTHVTQPADIHNFSIFKADYRKNVAKTLNEKMLRIVGSPYEFNHMPSAVLTNEDVGYIAKGPYAKAFSTTENIRSFAKAGIVPFTMRP